METKLNIGIIGCGEVGSLLLAQLNSKFTHSNFHILEKNPDISGKILDFEHAAQFQNNTIVWNDLKLFSKVEYLFYCAGIPNPPGLDRAVMAAQNKAIVKEVFGKLTFEKSTTIIVLSNPVEATCQWIDQFTSDDHLILGTGTYLDSIRLRTLLPEPNAMVFGEHGPNMVIQSASLENKAIDFVKIQQALTALATKIRQTEKGTKYGVVACALSLFQSLLEKENIEIPLCVKIPDALKAQFSISENLYLNLLVQLHPFEVKLPTLTSDERLAMQKAMEGVRGAG